MRTAMTAPKLAPTISVRSLHCSGIVGTLWSVEEEWTQTEQCSSYAPGNGAARPVWVTKLCAQVDA